MAKPQQVPEHEAKKKRAWYAVFRPLQLTETCVKGQVVRCFDDPDAAGQYRDKHKEFALFPNPLAEPPERGAAVELPRDAKGEDVQRHVRVLAWRETQGVHFGYGLWNDRGEEPRWGQFVTFTSGLDYRGEPRDRLVSPLRGVEPGQGKAPRIVLYERTPGTIDLGCIVDFAADAEEAVAKVKARDAEKARDPWVEFQASPRLRNLADRPVRPEEPFRVSTHQIDVVHRVGEDGTPQRSYIVTREATGPDGRTYTDSKVISSEDLKARREARQEKEQGREQAKSPEGEPRKTRPAGPVTAEEKAAEPPREPVPPTVEIRDNRHWTVGVWHGAKPPVEGQWILFPTGKERVEDRAMTPTPSKGKTMAPEPGEKLRYVVAKVVAIGPRMGAAVVHGSTRDRDYAVTRAESLVRQAEGKQRFQERSREQQARRLEESRRRHHDRSRERGASKRGRDIGMEM